MIAIREISAVVTRDLGIVSPWLSIVQQAEDRRSSSPAAQYALMAASKLATSPTKMAMICFSGPSGAHISRFDGACDSQKQLVSDGFAATRHRKIHPFTLLLALQNQVPAMLSMQLGMLGPCTNMFESGTSFAFALPLIEAYLRGGFRVLVVMSSAADRLEERQRTASFRASKKSFEGAICVVFDRKGELGHIKAESEHAEWLDLWYDLNVIEPVLMPGVGLLKAIHGKAKQVRVGLRDDTGFESSFCWEAV